MNRVIALAAIAAGLLLSGCSHPSAIQRACDQLAQANVLSHFSAADCVACTTSGGTYMWFMSGSGSWRCD